MSFTYFNEKQEYVIRKMMKELTDSLNGRNISVSDLVRGNDGYYSEDRFCEFLDRFVGQEDDLSDHERDYLKTLLYVVIRSMQAKIRFFPISVNGKPVTDDSFSDLIFAFDGTDGWPARLKFVPGKGFRSITSHLLNASMEATVRSVYYYITGEDTAFPDPYQMEPDQADDPDDGKVQISSEDDPDYSIESTRQYFDRQDYYEGYDFEEESEWQKENYGRRYTLDPANDPGDQALCDDQAGKIKTFFPMKDEFVFMYRHLMEITGPADRKCVRLIPAKIDRYLRDNDLTAYSDEMLCDKVFDLLDAASVEVVRWQEKKL